MKKSLKELRAREKITQSDMAEKLGVSIQTYFLKSRLVSPQGGFHFL